MTSAADDQSDAAPLIDADDAPPDPRSVRVVEFPAGPDGESPIVVAATGDQVRQDLEVRWLGHGRAAVTGTGVPGPGGASSPVEVVMGAVGPAGRDGRSKREVVVGGWRAVFEVESEARARLRDRARRGREDIAHGGPLDVRAIIPGRVAAVSVTEGEAVEAGQQLLVIEAMKMQNELRSPRAGIVEQIVVGAGQTVDLGALLLVLR